MSTFSYSKSTEGPVLLLDGEPVPPDATVTLTASTVAATMQTLHEAGYTAAFRAGAEACAKGIQAAWPEIAERFAGKAAAPRPIEVAGLADLVDALRESNQRPLEITTPPRVTTQRVKRDQQGRIVETVAVAEDVA
jgi:hypothetical protein